MPSDCKASKVLIIGLDGMPLDLVRSWAARGHLPNLQRLMEEGTSGELASTMPPTSGPAWSSFVTGKNPGKTGIYDFLYRREGSYVFPPVHAGMRGGRSLWALLGEAGRRVSVLNIPVSYPVEPVNGVMVSGWMTPYYATDYTYPRELGDEIRRAVGDYRIYPSETFSPAGERRFFQACDELLDLVTRTTLYLMDRGEWDLLMTVYFDTDRILHQLWHYIDPEHPWRAGDRQDRSAPVVRYFERLDADIGTILARAPQDTHVLVMSDHGMGRASRFIVLNNVLLDAGLLRLSTKIPSRLKRFAFERGFTLRNVHRLLDRLGLAKHAEYKNVYSFDGLLKRFFLSFLDVDWAHTQAYSFGRHYGSVFLNLQGREPQGCVRPADYERTRQEVARVLLDYVDRELGRPLFGRVHRREELYSGDRLQQAPDLVVIPRDRSDIVFGLSDFGSTRVWDSTYRYSGMHREQGLVIAKGGAFRRGATVDGAAIIDLAPTVLHLMGVALPRDLDGRVLSSMLTPEFVDDHPVCLSERDSGRLPTEAADYTPAEEAEIMDRLRDLGYLN